MVRVRTEWVAVYRRWKVAAGVGRRDGAWACQESSRGGRFSHEDSHEEGRDEQTKARLSAPDRGVPEKPGNYGLFVSRFKLYTIQS